MSQYQVVESAVTDLRAYAGNVRTHSKKQIKQIAASIERFGFTNPVLVSDDGEIIAGHGRVEAAKLLGWKTVPTMVLSHLSAVERRAYAHKYALNAGWDKDMRDGAIGFVCMDWRHMGELLWLNSFAKSKTACRNTSPRLLSVLSTIKLTGNKSSNIVAQKAVLCRSRSLIRTTSSLI